MGALRMNRSIKILARCLLVCCALIFALPFLWMLLTSLKPAADIYTMPLAMFGTRVAWSNYWDAWTFLPFGRFLFNSFFVSSSVMIIALITSSLAAYAFARISWKGRDAVFLLYLGTLMVPAQVTVIPLYLLMNILGWRGTYVSLILPVSFSAFGTFLLRQFFMTIPFEIEESGRIDGCNAFMLYSRIIMPMSVPALATLAIFTFIGQWKNFLWPLIVVSRDEIKTITVGLQMFVGQYATEWSVLMAAATLAIIPSIVMFMVFQRYLVSGIALTGMGGR